MPAAPAVACVIADDLHVQIYMITLSYKYIRQKHFSFWERTCRIEREIQVLNHMGVRKVSQRKQQEAGRNESTLSKRSVYTGKKQDCRETRMKEC